MGTWVGSGRRTWRMMCQFSCSGDGDKVPNQLGLRSVHKAQRTEHTVSHRGSTPHTHWEVRGGERRTTKRRGGRHKRESQQPTQPPEETTGDKEEPSRSMRDPQRKKEEKTETQRRKRISNVSLRRGSLLQSSSSHSAGRRVERIARKERKIDAAKTDKAETYPT